MDKTKKIIDTMESITKEVLLKLDGEIKNFKSSSLSEKFDKELSKRMKR
ncbi:MAG TPA: hypothetical protein VJI46_01345 [Candidatus Nanoarchaeia archaeon]|nr:hypothetical protein [Candidatus Nanoarchaeia archaeon]